MLRTRTRACVRACVRAARAARAPGSTWQRVWVGCRGQKVVPARIDEAKGSGPGWRFDVEHATDRAQLVVVLRGGGQSSWSRRPRGMRRGRGAESGSKSQCRSDATHQGVGGAITVDGCPAKHLAFHRQHLGSLGTVAVMEKELLGRGSKDRSHSSQWEHWAGMLGVIAVL